MGSHDLHKPANLHRTRECNDINLGFGRFSHCFKNVRFSRARLVEVWQHRIDTRAWAVMFSKQHARNVILVASALTASRSTQQIQIEITAVMAEANALVSMLKLVGPCFKSVTGFCLVGACQP
jgi:hypothetical protein